MTSTIGINEQQPRNLEIPRSAELLPEQIRVTATNFLQLIEEYYRFMNLNEFATVATSVPNSSKLSGKSGSGPTNVIHSILTQLDPDIVDEDYLTHIVSAIAPYVPLPSYMSTTSTVTVNPPALYKYHSTEELAFLRAQLYRKIVKYFYSTRGSRNSVKTFFRIFYNAGASIIDNNDYPSTIQYYVKDWLTTSGMPISMTTVSGGSLVYGQTPVEAWTPFTYVISTAVIGGTSTFDVPYQTMVHPIGFKYHFQPSGGDGENNVADSRMVHAREDYQKALWCLDSTTLAEYVDYRVGDASNPYVVDNRNVLGYTYADWSNIGSKTRFNLSNMLGLSGYDYLTTPSTTTSFNNISFGNDIRNITSSSAIPYYTTVVSMNIVNFSVSAVSISSAATQFEVFNDPAIFPGLFVSASGIPLNTYVTSISTSTLSAILIKNDYTLNTDTESDRPARPYWNSTSADLTNLITFRKPHSGISPGMIVSGGGIADGTTVTAIVVATSISVIGSKAIDGAVGAYGITEYIDFKYNSTKHSKIIPGLYISSPNYPGIPDGTYVKSVKTYTTRHNKTWWEKATNSGPKTTWYRITTGEVGISFAWPAALTEVTFSKCILAISSSATTTISGDVTFYDSNTKIIHLSAAATSTTSTASVTFYGGVINLTSTSTNFTALTDRIEIDA